MHACTRLGPLQLRVFSPRAEAELKNRDGVVECSSAPLSRRDRKLLANAEIHISFLQVATLKVSTCVCTFVPVSLTVSARTEERLSSVVARGITVITALDVEHWFPHNNVLVVRWKRYNKINFSALSKHLVTTKSRKHLWARLITISM